MDDLGVVKLVPKANTPKSSKTRPKLVPGCLPTVTWTIILWRNREGGKAEAVQMRGKPPGS